MHFAEEYTGFLAYQPSLLTICYKVNFHKLQLSSFAFQFVEGLAMSVTKFTTAISMLFSQDKGKCASDQQSKKKPKEEKSEMETSINDQMQ